MKKQFFGLVIFIFCLCPMMTKAQIFMPIISYYNSFTYHYGMQNWCCTQDDRGIMYFANNNGVLSYDGYSWRTIALPSKGLVRSILTDGDRIYVGSYTDFGYFVRDEWGKMEYHSLWPKEYQSHNDEIWNIVKGADGHIYFQSFCSYFVYDGKKVTPYYIREHLPLWFFKTGGQLYAQLISEGLCRVSKTYYPPILHRRDYGNDHVMGLHQLGKSLFLLATNQNGLFLYDGQQVKPVRTDVDALLRQALINRTVMLNKHTLVVGTIKSGIFAIDLNTNKVLWHYSKANGLGNNTVLNLLVDKTGNLWAALDNGIALIHTGLPLSVMKLEGIGMVYDVATLGSDMYIATNQSVWRYDMKEHYIVQVNGCEGQNWYVSQFDNQVFAGHNLGTRALAGNQSFGLLNDNQGSTMMREYQHYGQHALIESSYNSFRIYLRDGDKWRYGWTVKGFGAPIRLIEIDNQGVIWAAHMSKGLYRLELSRDMRRFDKVNYYSSLPNSKGDAFHVMTIMGRVVFSYGGRLFTYDDIRKQILPYYGCGRLSDMGIVSSAFLDKKTFWLLNSDGYWLMHSGSKENLPVFFISNSSFGQECNIYGHSMYASGRATYFFLNDGIGRYLGTGAEMGKKPACYKASFCEVTTKDRDNVAHQLPVVSDGKVKAWGNIRLRVSFPNYDNDKLLFCYTLKGGGNTLTESSYSPEIVYSNFGFGDYELTVVVKNLKGDIIGKPLVYCFSFPAPFLLSWWAWLMYLLLLSALVYGFIRWRTNKIIRRNKKIAEKELMEQKMKSLEQERIIAEQQKQLLENELALKGKDVASMAFDMVAMNNSISEAKETLLEGMRKGTITTKNASKLLLQMKSGDNDLFWNTFQNNFDLIHKKFFRSLREKYPDLTSNDLKVCALLRLNLNTKDIANFTHLTIRGVEGARYRLRKKLGIPTDKSLTDFLIEFE